MIQILKFDNVSFGERNCILELFDSRGKLETEQSDRKVHFSAGERLLRRSGR